MDIEANVLKIVRSVSRMEGEIREIRKLSQRVSHLEQWMFYLKGAWGVLAAACAGLCRLVWVR
jgi:hypothetical protein